METIIIYAEGGFDPSKPDNNIVSVEEVEAPVVAPTMTDALAAAARLVVADKIAAAAITADDAPILAPLFDPWRPGEAVEVGDLRQWSGTLVECLQAHTTQADWTPDATPALWRIYRDPEAETPAEWVQPTGAHDAYNIGDRVTFDGQVYESLIDGNVHSPAAYPAGWTLIDT